MFRIIAICAGVVTLSAISLQAGPLSSAHAGRTDGRRRPSCGAGPRWLRIRATTHPLARPMGPLALGPLRSEDVGSLPRHQFSIKSADARSKWLLSPAVIAPSPATAAGPASHLRRSVTRAGGFVQITGWRGSPPGKQPPDQLGADVALEFDDFAGADLRAICRDLQDPARQADCLERCRRRLSYYRDLVHDRQVPYWTLHRKQRCCI